MKNYRIPYSALLPNWGLGGRSSARERGSASERARCCNGPSPSSLRQLRSVAYLSHVAFILFRVHKVRGVPKDGRENTSTDAAASSNTPTTVKSQSQGSNLSLAKAKQRRTSGWPQRPSPGGKLRLQADPDKRGTESSGRFQEENKPKLGRDPHTPPP